MKHSLTRVPDIRSGKVEVTYREVIHTPLNDEVTSVPPAKRVYWNLESA